VGGVVFALLAALCNAVSVIARHIASRADPHRPTGRRLGSATGVAWALEAAFIKSMTDDAAEGGVVGLFTHWPVYAVTVGGAAGVLLEQAALQAGVVVMSLTAPATLQADERPDLTRPG
jgi:hypothetical protein